MIIEIHSSTFMFAAVVGVAGGNLDDDGRGETGKLRTVSLSLVSQLQFSLRLVLQLSDVPLVDKSWSLRSKTLSRK